MPLDSGRTRSTGCPSAAARSAGPRPVQLGPWAAAAPATAGAGRRAVAPWDHGGTSRWPGCYAGRRRDVNGPPITPAQAERAVSSRPQCSAARFARSPRGSPTSWGSAQHRDPEVRRRRGQLGRHGGEVVDHGPARIAAPQDREQVEAGDAGGLGGGDDRVQRAGGRQLEGLGKPSPQSP